MPSPGNVLARSLMARGQAFEMHLGDDDVSIRMPYPADMSVMDWGRHTELMERSYEFGRTELARLASAGKLDGLVDGRPPDRPLASCSDRHCQRVASGDEKGPLLRAAPNCQGEKVVRTPNDQTCSA